MTESYEEKEEPSRSLIAEVLGDIYHSDQILTKEIGVINDVQCELRYVFPPFTKTIHPLPHVSSDQMQLACLEGLYCTIGNAIRQGALKNIPIDYPTFLANRHRMALLEERKQYRKELQPNEEATLLFSIQGYGTKKLRREFYYVIVSLDGFIRGEYTCIIPADIVTPSPPPRSPLSSPPVAQASESPQIPPSSSTDQKSE